MATFTFTPDYGAADQVKSNTTEAAFGGGYAQRAQVGMNPIQRVWNVPFTGTPERIEAIYGFFSARSFDLESFYWQPPSGAFGKWKLQKDSLKRIKESYGKATLSAVFEEVFES